MGLTGLMLNGKSHESLKHDETRGDFRADDGRNAWRDLQEWLERGDKTDAKKSGACGTCGTCGTCETCRTRETRRAGESCQTHETLKLVKLEKPTGPVGLVKLVRLVRLVRLVGLVGLEERGAGREKKQRRETSAVLGINDLTL